MLACFYLHFSGRKKRGMLTNGIFGVICYPVEDVVRICTDERGTKALTYPDDIDARKAPATAKGKK